MDLQLNEQQRLLQASLDRYLDRALPFEVRRKQSDPEDFLACWTRFSHDLGIAGAGIEAEFGGLGGGAEAEMLVAAGLGRALAVTPYVDAQVIAGKLLNAIGRGDEIRGLASNDSLIVVALEEAQTRGDVALTECWGDPVAGGWRFTGSKIGIPFAAEADSIIVPARVSDSDFALFALTREQAGGALRPYRWIDDTPVADLLLDGLEVPAETLIAQGPHLLGILAAASDRGLAALCAEAAAIARVMLNDTVSYTKERKQFGASLASFQALQHRMVDMFIKTEELAAASLLATLKVGDAGAVSAAKATAAEGVRLIGQEAVQLHGAMGLTEELRIGHYFKRATVLEQRLGSADMYVDRYRKAIAAS